MFILILLLSKDLRDDEISKKDSSILIPKKELQETSKIISNPNSEHLSRLLNKLLEIR